MAHFRFVPESDRIAASPRNDAMGHIRTLLSGFDGYDERLAVGVFIIA